MTFISSFLISLCNDTRRHIFFIDLHIPVPLIPTVVSQHIHFRSCSGCNGSIFLPVCSIQYQNHKVFSYDRTEPTDQCPYIQSTYRHMFLHSLNDPGSLTAFHPKVLWKFSHLLKNLLCCSPHIKYFWYIYRITCFSLCQHKLFSYALAYKSSFFSSIFCASATI